MKQRFLYSITIVILVFSLFGCSLNGIKKPDVETKKVTQNTYENYVTYDWEVPKDCEVFETGTNSITCLISSEKHKYLPYQNSPYELLITHYLMPNFIPVNDEYKQAYKDLFEGKYEGIKKLISDNIEYINIGEVMERYPDIQFESPESILDYFNILVDGFSSTPDIPLPDGWDDIVWVNDFEFNEYNGKNAKIIAVEYSFMFLDKTYRAINCYRDDNYSVCGVFDEELELTSGDIALWVADNMKVTEHFKIEDNRLKLEGKDY